MGDHKDMWPDEHQEKLLLKELSDLPEGLSYEGNDGIKKRFKQKTKNRRKPVIRLLPALAAVLILGTISVTATRGVWHLKNPGTYEGDTIKVDESKVYIWDEKESSYVKPQDETESETESPSSLAETESSEVFDDYYYLNSAKSIIDLVCNGKESITTQDMTINYQINEWYQREEAEVHFTLSDKPGSVKFDRKSGNLIGITYWTGENHESDTLMSEEAALACARDWYEKLPYPKGYEYASVAKYDDHAWSYDFTRMVEIDLEGEHYTLKNYLEDARITIDPTNGALTLGNCFYVPLLDDHEEGQEPIHKEDALALAADWTYNTYSEEDKALLSKEGTVTLSNGQVIEVSIKPVIARPRYESVAFHKDSSSDVIVSEEPTTYTKASDPIINYHFSDVTRLAWQITYKVIGSEFANEKYLSIDLYTGSPLSFEMTK